MSSPFKSLRTPVPALAATAALLLSTVAAFGGETAHEAVVAFTVLRSEHSTGGDGVTRDASYRERFVRDAGHVWIERLDVPPRKPAPGGADHVHADTHLALSPRLYTKATAGPGVDLALVAREARLIVEVAPPERGLFGGDPSWEEASSLVAATVRKSLRPSARPVPPDAPSRSRWLERHANGEFLRVLWSDDLGIALILEAGTDDSRLLRRFECKREGGATAVPPWQQVAGFARKDYSDFGD